MTSPTIPNKFTALNSDDILYHFYSYDGLHYIIDVLKGYYDNYRTKAQEKDPLFNKKCSMLKFEIIAHFSHYAENLGAFLYPCHKENPSLNSVDILENLTKYEVWQIDKFYQDFNSEYVLDDNRRNNFNRLFGYDHIITGQGAEQLIDLSLINILSVLKAIAEFYNFWKYSYNAYKHGYRIWYGDEYNQNLNVAIYLRKCNRMKPQNSMDHLPIDDRTIEDVHNFTNYCRHIFDIFFDNHKSLLKSGSHPNGIEFDFLEYTEPRTKIIKKYFNI
jgi:hypothetical protein